MRRIRTYPQWIGAEGEENLRYHHLSYVFFRTYGDGFRILGSRCPDEERFAVGRPLGEALRLDEEMWRFLSSTREDRLLFVYTNVGVGILDRRFALYGGIGVYWHILADPDSLGRLINHGVLGDGAVESYEVSRSVVSLKSLVRAQDVPVYPVLAEVWDMVKNTVGSLRADDVDGCVRGAEIVRMIGKMADFAGCQAIREEGETLVERARCRRPQWLELCLLYLLTEVHRFSANGQVTYSVGSLGGLEGEGLSLQFRYPLEDMRLHTDVLTPVHEYLAQVGGYDDMEFFAELVPPKRGQRQQGVLPEMRFYLNWLRDPTVLVSSDLKAGQGLKGNDSKESDSGESDSDRLWPFR